MTLATRARAPLSQGGVSTEGGHGRYRVAKLKVRRKEQRASFLSSRENEFPIRGFREFLKYSALVTPT
jgi:hypothetical protein